MKYTEKDYKKMQYDPAVNARSTYFQEDLFTVFECW